MASSGSAPCVSLSRNLRPYHCVRLKNKSNQWKSPNCRCPAEASTRWYALQSLLARNEIAEEPEQVSLEGAPPVLSVLSLAGGVGKTCLVATLGRALSALGERVLLADTAACGLLPFYFGSHDFRPGVVRTFSPPASAPRSRQMRRCTF